MTKVQLQKEFTIIAFAMLQNEALPSKLTVIHSSFLQLYSHHLPTREYNNIFILKCIHIVFLFVL